MEHYSYMDFFNMPVEKGAEICIFVRKNEEDFLRLKGTLRQAVSEKLGCTSSQSWRGLKTRQERAGVMLWDMQRPHGLRGRAGLCGRRKDRLRRFFRRRTGLHVACGHG